VTKPTFQVKLEGPFFTRDPRKTVRQNIRVFMDELAAHGEAKGRGLADAPAGQMPRWTGRTRNRIKGRTRAEMRRGGKHWALTAVVSANTEGLSRTEAISVKAAGSRMEKRFRIFKGVLYSMRARIRSIDFTKGLE